ncbi:MAG: type II toxin-antitoxin system RelE family toxin [Acidobacteriota bacterium]
MYKIFLLPPAQKDLDKLRGKIFNICVKKITSLQENPRPHGCVKLTAEQGYRIRSGNDRILCRIDDKNKKVFIYRIKHRKEAY